MKQISIFLAVLLFIQLGMTMGVGFRNSETGLALDSNGDGRVYSITPNGGPFQNWIIENTDNNALYLKNKATQRYLESSFNGKVFTSPNKGNNQQKWRFDGLRIINVATQYALDSFTDGSQIATRPPHGGGLQKWVHF